MNKRFSKFMLTSASALALLAAYPSVASTANEALGVNLPSVSVSAAANEDAFVLQVKRLAYNDAIAEMEVLDLTSTSAAVQAARASYDALSASGKANSTVSNWEANLRSKEAAVGAAFVRQVKLLPYVSDIDASDSADVRAVRALYVALPASAKANAAVITWEGNLTSKQAALPETSEIDAFLDAAKALPYLSEIAEMDADELEALSAEMEEVRSLYDALSDEAKADANVDRWEGYLGDKEEAVLEASTPVEEELVVDSVSAINDKTVKVTFNKEVEEKIELSNVVVTEEKSGEKVFIKSAKLADDKVSLEIDFYDSLKSKNTYNFAITVGEEVVKASLDFVIGEVAKIELANQTIENNGDLEYKVLDENGLDITKDHKVTVKSDKSKFVAADGKVTTTLVNETAFVELSITKKDGKVVKTPRVTVKAEAKKAVAFGTDWTLVTTGTTAPDFKDEEYKQNTTLNMGTAKDLKVTLKDQFGKDIPANSNVKFETLDASVAIVDEVTGKVTPRKEGKALVRVSIMDGDKVVETKTVELQVVGKAKLAGIEVDSTSLQVTKDFTSDLKVKLVDQFGNPIEGPVTVEFADETIARKEGSAVAKTLETATDGKLALAVKGHKAGTTSVKLTSGDFTQSVSVSVVAAGEIADYEVKGFVSGLLVEDDAKTTDVNESEMTLTVNAVDKDGLTVKKLTHGLGAGEFAIEVTDSEDKDVAIANGNTIKASDFDGKKGPFTVKVTVGELPVLEKELTVTDNRVAPKYTVKSNNVKITDLSEFKDLFNGEILEFTDTVTIDDVNFVSANEAVIKDAGNNDGTVTSTEDGKTSIYVDELTVTVSSGQFVLDLEGMKVNVNVVATAQGEVDTKLNSVTTPIDEIKLENGNSATDAKKLAAVKEAVINTVNDTDFAVAVKDLEDALANIYEVTLSKDGASASKDVTVSSFVKTDLEVAKEALQDEVDKVRFATTPLEVGSTIAITDFETGTALDVKADSTDASTVANATKYYELTDAQALETVYNAASAALANPDSTKEQIEAIKLADAINTLKGKVKVGTQE